MRNFLKEKRNIGKIRKQLADMLEEFFDDVQPDDLVPMEGRHRNKTATNGYGLGHRW